MGNGRSSPALTQFRNPRRVTKLRAKGPPGVATLGDPSAPAQTRERKGRERDTQGGARWVPGRRLPVAHGSAVQCGRRWHRDRLHGHRRSTSSSRAATGATGSAAPCRSRLPALVSLLIPRLRPLAGFAGREPGLGCAALQADAALVSFAHLTEFWWEKHRAYVHVLSGFIIHRSEKRLRVLYTVTCKYQVLGDVHFQN